MIEKQGKLYIYIMFHIFFKNVLANLSDIWIYIYKVTQFKNVIIFFYFMIIKKNVKEILKVILILLSGIFIERFNFYIFTFYALPRLTKLRGILLRK